MTAVLAIFLILHAVVHIILAMAPNPDAAEPVFATFFTKSWLLPGSGRHYFAYLLAAAAAIGFVMTGLSLLDILVPIEWWRGLAIVSSLVSLLLLVLFWNRYLVIGVVIDVLVLVVVFFTNWSPS